MASVYEALDPALDRHVALKVLPAEFLHDPAFADRFRQEARVAAKLEHPHIVPIHAYGIEGGRPWMAMRLVTGGSLAERVRALLRCRPARRPAVLRDVAAALDYAHARGVVHRDVKPANVLLDEAGRAYLADFGIARMLEGSSVATATGLIQGTPSYMAPEQAMGAKVDRLADVYALGVVAFECLTGRVPYTGTTPVAILMKHVQEPVPEPTEAEVAPALTAVLRRCLAKTPAERWPTAGAFSAALESRRGRRDPAGRHGLARRRWSCRRPRRARHAALRHVARSAGRRRPSPASAGTCSGPRVGGAPGPRRPGLRGSVAPPGPPRALSPPARPSPIPAATAARPAATHAGVDSAPARPGGADARASRHPDAAASAPSPRRPGPTPAPSRSRPCRRRPRRASATPPARARSGPIRVYCEAKLEPVLYRKTGQKDVADSLKDLKEAIAERRALELVPRHEADAVVQVLERGREPAVIGMRKVRVRVVLGRRVRRARPARTR